MKNKKVTMMVEGAVMIALAVVLSFIRVIKLPWGGSVTLFSMLPIMLFSIRRGLKYGFAVSFIFSLFELFQGITDGLFGWGLTIPMLLACICIDYIGAYSVIGIAGIFRNKNTAGYISGIILAVFIRFMFHFISGVVIWHSIGKLWGEFSTENSFVYSFCYNAAYMLPEMIITIIAAVILIKIPQTKKLLTEFISK